MYADLFLLVTFAFLFSLVASRVEKLPISGPVIFLGFGFAVGPLALGWIEIPATFGAVRLLADLTLAVVLFVDAAHANQRVLERNIRLPGRMLLIGLPGSILLGGLCAFLFRDQLGFFQMALLGVMLAATDAALGKAVFSNRDVPAHLRVSLNVESGLNDGLCVPLLLLCIALSLADGSGAGSDGLAVSLVVREIGIGAGVGLAVSAFGSWLFLQAARRAWLRGVWRQFPAMMLALACFTLAHTLEASGYIASFVGGMVFHRLTGTRGRRPLEDADGLGEVLAMLTWITVGAVIIGQSFHALDWRVALYVVLSLTVVRMLPVYLSLTGTGESPASRLFLGWFGPRGLASLVFAAIVLEENVEGGDLISAIVVCTVFTSAVVHGVTATPLSAALARHLSGSAGR